MGDLRLMVIDMNLNEEHKKVIMECIDESPPAVLEQVMEQLK